MKLELKEKVTPAARALAKAADWLDAFIFIKEDGDELIVGKPGDIVAWPPLGEPSTQFIVAWELLAGCLAAELCRAGSPPAAHMTRDWMKDQFCSELLADGNWNAAVPARIAALLSASSGPAS